MDLEDLSSAAVVAGADAEPVLERMRPIKGWFSDAEARLLLNVACCALMELCDGHEVVEVGAYEGRSTVVLASAVQALHFSGRLVSVDPHEGVISLAGRPDQRGSSTYAAFCRNLNDAGLRQFVDIRRTYSAEVPWTRPIGLLFIDGLHDYRSVRGDYDHFAPWVPPGGYVAFHDYSRNFPDVVTCVEEIHQQGCFAVRGVEGDLIVLQRRIAGTPT